MLYMHLNIFFCIYIFLKNGNINMHKYPFQYILTPSLITFPTMEKSPSQ